VSNPSPLGHGVWTIAHRGASHERPENTLSSFDEALNQNCDAIELDLQLSRDGMPVVYHDRTLTKAGGGRRRVASLMLEELRRLDAGAWFGPEFRGLSIPTLSEVLERYASQTRLLLEIKLRADHTTRVRLVHAVADEVRRCRAEERVFLLCFDPELLGYAEKIAPELRRVINVGRISARRSGPRSQPADFDAVSVDVRALTPRLAAGVRRSGRPLLTFTCNRASEVDRSLEAGAVGVMSDKPAWLSGYLGESGGDR